MNVTMIQGIAALSMAGIAIILFYAYRRYLATNSERRMRAMIESVGLDPLGLDKRPLKVAHVLRPERDLVLALLGGLFALGDVHMDRPPSVACGVDYDDELH